MRGPQPWQANRARVLRANTTKAEARLWRELRNRNLLGQKFVRQESIGPYFTDFLCREARLVVEIDGATHGEDHEIEADADRTAYLQASGYRVFRATNDDVLNNLTGVLEGILRMLEDNQN